VLLDEDELEELELEDDELPTTNLFQWIFVPSSNK
jgi:hypothetical protein